jgi:hypothetical protein
MLNDGKADHVARCMFNPANRNGTRPRHGRAFHEKELARYPIWIAFHDDGAVLQMRQKPPRDVQVVLQEISLR